MERNATHYCLCLTREDLPKEEHEKLKTRGAALKSVLWPQNHTITIRFLSGEPSLRQRVEEAARQWLQHVNLDFAFLGDKEPADIRIDFRQGAGSWSFLGTDCKGIKEPEPTMNFGWLTPASTPEEIESVVLHEFGHALGLIHEHQNPKGAIEWNKAAVIKDLSGPPNNWNMATIERNMFQLEPVDAVIASDVDKDSIMMYPVPESWTIGDFSAGFNRQLSLTDIQIIKSVYPR